MPRLTEDSWVRALLPLVALPVALDAQGPDRALEFHVGRWYNGNHASVYDFRTSSALGRVFTQGVAALALVDDSLGRRRAFYGLGYELEAWRGRAVLGPYAVAGLALGLSTDTSTQALAALWSLGAGLEWRPLSWIAVGTEVRWRLEDRGPRGFWRAAPTAPSGATATFGMTLGGGRWGRGRGTRRAGGVLGRQAAPARAAELAAPAPAPTEAGDVVETALAALGTPYIWGGTADNGFDCSGLIQYAYAAHGVRLPRMSREQAGVGAAVTPVLEALHPGDILLFSAQPGAGVTHVGLYVGAGKFIHSATAGVKLSQLDPHDPEGSYWMDRWLGARRVIP